MGEAGEHAACVDAWLARLPTQLPTAGLLGVFEAVVHELWGDASRTLGDLMVHAIVGRVLHIGAEHNSSLGLLRLTAGGVSFALLIDQSALIDPVKLRASFRFFLVELLTLLGNLTAEILTPGLQRALARVTWPLPGVSPPDPDEKDLPE